MSPLEEEIRNFVIDNFLYGEDNGELGIQRAESHFDQAEFNERSIRAPAPRVCYTVLFM